MNPFYKLSVLFAAVALSTTATAGYFTGNQTTGATANENAIYLSTQGLASAGVSTVQYLPAVSYTLGANYLVNDEISFTFAAAYDVNTVFDTNITVGGATFQKVNATPTVVTYRVVAGAANAGSVFTFAQNKVSAADLTDTTKAGIVIANAQIGTALITAASKTSAAAAFDADTTQANANKFLISTTQFGSIKLTSTFNGVIDDSVAGASKVFLNAEVNDSASFVYTAPTLMPTQALLGQDIGLNDLTATADQVAQFLDIDTTVLAASQNNYTITSAVPGSVVMLSTINVDKLRITVAYPKGTSPFGDTITITPKTGASAPVMLASTFAFGSAANGSQIAFLTDMGKWTLTGSSTVSIPYMPYGTGLSQVIYANNTTVSDAEVSVVAYDEAGMSYDLGVVGAASAKSVTKLATVIKNALAAAGVTEGRLAMDVTFRGVSSLTGGDIKLHSGYNANASDRGFVSNTTNGAK
jgi:hypothetical protein